MEIPFKNPKSHSPPPSTGGTTTPTFPTSPEFEFWMVRNPSFPQPNLLSADQLFVDGVLLPLHLVSQPTDPNPDPPPSEPVPSDGPKLTPNSAESPPSKRWSIFKKIEKKNASGNQEDPEKKKKKKETKIGSGSTSPELNINIWPFSRSRSAGNGLTRPKMFPGGQPGSRKVNSAPCSRSNSTGESKSRKLPTSPNRAGVHLGRSSPVWQVRRVSSAVKTPEKPARKEPTVAHRSKASAAASASRVRVLNLNVPVCIGYRNHLSCRSEETSALGVVGGAGAGGNGDGSSVSNSGSSISTTSTNLFSIRSLFSKKVH